MKLSERLIDPMSVAVKTFFRLAEAPAIQVETGPGLGQGVKFRIRWTGGTTVSKFAESCHSMRDLVAHIKAGGALKLDYYGDGYAIAPTGTGTLANF